jgi:sterol desaturase/sphingolipid hydroxylase (fatty acid hydroxylase superfamily)
MHDDAPAVHADRGWRPDEPLGRAPLFKRPFSLAKTLKFILRMYFGSPLAVFYWTLPVLTWIFLSPDLGTIRQLEPGWIGAILARNLLLIALFAGALHWHLYVRKAQGMKFKYRNAWPSAQSRTFLFTNQTRDNVFWTLCSAVPIWTAYEVLSLWAMANGFIAHVDFLAHPVYCGLLFMLIPVFHDLHFYLTHRLIHWPPIYRRVHYLHHKNVNPGPWSGLAMHPVEHVVFFSGVLLLWILPASPLHVIYYLQGIALGAVQGHSGFQKAVIGGKEIKHGDYFHYLHHKFFQCNYGGGFLPLDEWRGTCHDGSEESESRMRQRVKLSRTIG